MGDERGRFQTFLITNIDNLTVFRGCFDSIEVWKLVRYETNSEFAFAQGSRCRTIEKFSHSSF